MTAELKRKVLRRNIEIAYLEAGPKNRPSLLFLHGLANYHGVWQWNIETLETHFRCIAVDLPGNGFSGRNSKDYSMDFYTETMTDFIQEMNLKSVTLVGHSMGGLIALKIALSKKIHLQSIILFAPAGFEYYTPHESVLFKSAINIGNFLNMDETQMSHSVRNSFYKQNDITDKIIKDLSLIIQSNGRPAYRAMLEQSVHSMLDDSIFSKLKNIEEKTLVFFGEDDMLIPNKFLHPVSTTEIAKKATQQMPNATLITYRNCGHFVQIENAKEVNAAIIQFLKT